MSFDFSTLITDRAQSDLSALKTLLAKPVDQWTEEEKTQFASAASKGAYNYTDLNRVTDAMTYLDEVLKGYGYETGFVPVKVHKEPEPEQPLLPDGYTELEYIESTGTQWINTGVNSNQSSKVVCVCEFLPKDSASWIFGVREGTYVNTFNFLTTNNLYRSDYGNSGGSTFANKWDGFFTITKDGPVTKINEEIVDTLNEQTFNCSLPLYIFANNNNGVLQGQCASKIKLFEVYNANSLLRNYVPCKNPSNEVGLYDMVTQEFYGNAGTGDFVAGPEVIPEPVPSPLDPYTWYESDSPTASQMTQYLSNVINLCDVLSLNPDLPQQIVKLTQNGANQIESALFLLWQTIQQVVNGFARSNCFTFWSGNRPFPCASSNKGRTWAELDAMNTKWRNWQVATWYLLLYGNLKAEGDVV